MPAFAGVGKCGCLVLSMMVGCAVADMVGEEEAELGVWLDVCETVDGEEDGEEEVVNVRVDVCEIKIDREIINLG
jgi:hypothetical protein